jgi:putative DNA primase/helicase
MTKMPVIIVKKAQAGAHGGGTQSETTPPAAPLPATNSPDGTGTAGNDNDQQSALARAAAEEPKNPSRKISSDYGLLDEKTGEPLAAPRYLEEVDESAWPGEVDHEPVDEAGDDEPELTEDYVAHDFITRYDQELRFDHDVRSWYGWDGTHWRKDETRATFDKVRGHCRALRGCARMMSSKRAIEGVEVMASRDPRVAMTTRKWNTDPWLLGTPGGYVNLKTGQVFDADPTLNVLQLTSAAPAEIGTAIPHFAKFLNEVTQGDPGLQRFLQQYFGYCLTGITSEQALFFIYGPGGNGKSVLQTVISDIMGDYAKTAAMEAFSATGHSRHLTEIAMLRSARLVTLSETEKGQRWSQTRVNQVTGGDSITANFMRQDHFTFRPMFKTFVVGNHKPHLTSVNDAERRRFLIVPFLHKPVAPDKQLPSKLRDESPGILRWMINGCLDWAKNGFVLPAVVKEATTDYFESEDLLGRWVEECCERGVNLKAKAQELWESYRKFAAGNGEDAGSMKSFASALASAGFEKKKSGGIIYIRIALKTQPGK